MRDQQKNHTMLLLGIVTSLLTIAGPMIQIGSLKGELIEKVAGHEKRIDHHEAQLATMRDDVVDIKARIHGIASQVGKLPGQVAAKIAKEGEGD